ncbi:MAG: glycosyltransferase family 39 protein [Candidatus Omnitrophota bacterium]
MKPIDTKEENPFLTRSKKYAPFFLLILTATFLRIYLLRFRLVPEGDSCHYLSFVKDFQRGDFSTIGTYWSLLWTGLITLFGSVLGDIELSGYLLSAFFGIMLIILAFIFARRIFNKRVAYYTALLLTANLGLLNFSTRIFTESLYGFLLFGIAFLGWVSLERQKNSYFFLLGLLIGLTYTVRPEALAFLFVFSILILIARRKKAFLTLLIFCMATALFVLPVVIFYRVQFGTWTLGSKGTINFFIGENDTELYRERNELTEDLSDNLYYKTLKDEIKQKGMLAYLAENRFFVKRFFINYKKFFLHWPHQFLTLPRGRRPLSVIFFALGSWACLFVYKDRRKKYLYLLLFPFVIVTVLASCFVEERKIVPLIVFFVFIISCGADWLQTVLPNKPAKTLYQVILAGLITISSIMAVRQASKDPPSNALLMKEIGLWMRDHFSQEERITLTEPYIQYYFYEKGPDRHLGLIYFEDYRTLARYMKSYSSKYLFIFSWLVPQHPAVTYLFNHEVDEFVLLKSFFRDDCEIRLYELK